MVPSTSPAVRVTINTPEMKQAVEQYMTMYDSGAMLTGTDAATFRRLFADGGIGFTFDNGLGTQIGSFPQMSGNAYVAPTPFEGGSQLALPLYIAISEDSPNKCEAAMLLEYFLSEAVQCQLSTALRGELPATFDWDNPCETYQAFLEDAYWVGPLEIADRDRSTGRPAGSAEHPHPSTRHDRPHRAEHGADR